MVDWIGWFDCGSKESLVARIGPAISQDEAPFSLMRTTTPVNLAAPLSHCVELAVRTSSVSFI